MKLTLQLTKDMSECEKLYRLMCFHVFAHNRDDYSKNFTYLYREEEKRWTLSPSYDLTYSNSIGGEHATTVNGNGVSPGMDDIVAVAKKIGLNTAKARKTAAWIRECVFEMLQDYIRIRTYRAYFASSSVRYRIKAETACTCSSVRELMESRT